MHRIHPTEGKIDVGELATTSKSPSVWTVWNKSSMAFPGTDGFSVYDSNGRLAFRVDNYSRRHNCFTGELLLMDGNGRALMALRPQILSMHGRWSGFKGDDGLKTKTRYHVFSMRRRSIFQSGDKAEVFIGSPNDQSPTPTFQIEGYFRRRCCKIRDSKGKEVAQICPKKANNSVMLGNDVFSLVIQPEVECELIMAFLIIMDRICQKPFTPWICP
ncbi:protein LURP-one-related 8-like [Elaeis guineensis]|uniref:Protein LURP-one-related 8-like n=1 Tax=Elaeis guineensis var. tenera TaxID=51953 RepID=A0A6I9S0Z6_ELAGV|nr:protein LURP-one-related 8-like [Elaeis guineensis]